MHMHLQSSLMAFLAAGSAMAHMNMKDPAPLAYKGNPNAKEPNIDYSITSPLQASQFPCKGWLKLIGTDEGASVKTYAPGEQSTMTVEGGAAHNGGSCQLSLSYDQKTFTVIKSFIGNCPTSSGGSFDFTIPEDAPEGDDVVLSWSWVNKTGNREFYQSCAVVTIKGSGKRKRSSSTVDKRATVAWADRPKMFEANLGGEYCTKEGVDTVYPEPGPDVENTASSPGPAILCSTGADAPEGSDSDSGSGSGSGSSSSSSAAAQSSPASTSITGGVFLTTADTAPTTLSTATSPPATSASATSAPVSSVKASSSSAAAGNQGTATSSSAPSSTGGVSGQQTGACSNEGAWNCIDGSSFQRCASGQWSAAISMAAGTKCSTGVSDNLQMRRRDRVRRRGFSAWDW